MASCWMRRFYRVSGGSEGELAYGMGTVEVQCKMVASWDSVAGIF